MIFIFLILLSFIDGGSKPTEMVDLKIVVTNIHVLKGSVEMGIFNNPKTFLLKGRAYKTYSQKVANDTIIFFLNGIKKDNYAISIYHDINSDKECNLNFWGNTRRTLWFFKKLQTEIFKAIF